MKCLHLRLLLHRSQHSTDIIKLTIICATQKWITSNYYFFIFTFIFQLCTKVAERFQLWSLTGSLMVFMFLILVYRFVLRSLTTCFHFLSPQLSESQSYRPSQILWNNCYHYSELKSRWPVRPNFQRTNDIRIQREEMGVLRFSPSLDHCQVVDRKKKD